MTVGDRTGAVGSPTKQEATLLLPNHEAEVESHESVEQARLTIITSGLLLRQLRGGKRGTCILPGMVGKEAEVVGPMGEAEALIFLRGKPKVHVSRIMLKPMPVIAVDSSVSRTDFRYGRLLPSIQSAKSEFRKLSS